MLIITYGKPHKPSSSDTTSRWIKDKLGMAGLNMNVYKPHSCRCAFTSKARDNGVGIIYVLKQGCWKIPEYIYKILFQRHYK